MQAITFANPGRRVNNFRLLGIERCPTDSCALWKRWILNCPTRPRVNNLSAHSTESLTQHELHIEHHWTRKRLHFQRVMMTYG